MSLVDTFESSKTEFRTSIAMFEHIDERGWAGSLMLPMVFQSQQDKRLWQGALQTEERHTRCPFWLPETCLYTYIYCNILSHIRIT